MNGPEHYTEAERILGAIADAGQQMVDAGAHTDTIVHSLAATATRAQVHATLALAAATAFSGRIGEWVELEDECAAWAKATEATT